MSADNLRMLAQRRDTVGALATAKLTIGAYEDVLLGGMSAHDAAAWWLAGADLVGALTEAVDAPSRLGAFADRLRRLAAVIEAEA